MQTREPFGQTFSFLWRFCLTEKLRKSYMFMNGVTFKTLEPTTVHLTFSYVYLQDAPLLNSELPVENPRNSKHNPGTF